MPFAFQGTRHMRRKVSRRKSVSTPRPKPHPSCPNPLLPTSRRLPTNPNQTEPTPTQHQPTHKNICVNPSSAPPIHTFRNHVASCRKRKFQGAAVQPIPPNQPAARQWAQANANFLNHYTRYGQPSPLPPPGASLANIYLVYEDEPFTIRFSDPKAVAKYMDKKYEGYLGGSKFEMGAGHGYAEEAEEKGGRRKRKG